MAHYIQYSKEHIHVIEGDGESCYLSRNWHRCTADKNHTIEEAGGECEVNKTSYYDGDNWQYWTGDWRACFAPRIYSEDEEGNTGEYFLKLPDGELI